MNIVKICQRCKKHFKAESNHPKYCVICRNIAINESKRAYDKKNKKKKRKYFKEYQKKYRLRPYVKAKVKVWQKKYYNKRKNDSNYKDKIKAYQKEYYGRDSVKKKRSKYFNAYWKERVKVNPELREKRNKYLRNYRDNEAYKEYQRKYHQVWRIKKHNEMMEKFAKAAKEREQKDVKQV